MEIISSTLMFYLNATINAGAFLYSLFQNLKYHECKNRYNNIKEENEKLKEEMEEMRQDNIALIEYIKRSNTKIDTYEVDISKCLERNYNLKLQMKKIKEHEELERERREFFFEEASRIVQNQRQRRKQAENDCETTETNLDRLERRNNILEAETQSQKIELIKLRCALRKKNKRA